MKRIKRPELHGIVCLAIIGSSGPAFASLPVPVPLIGSHGPLGLGIVLIGYAAYRLFVRLRDR